MSGNPPKGREFCHRSIGAYVFIFFAICIVLFLLDTALSVTASGSASAAERIVLEHSYDIEQGAPVLEQRIVDDEGTTYLLKEIRSPVPASDIGPTRQFVATVQRPVSLDLENQGASAVQSLFDDALRLDTGDYVGTLRLQSVSQEPIYRSVEEQIERVIVYSDRASEDVLQLPEQEEFIVSSDEKLEATTTQSLNRLAVSWEVTGYDADGRPERYEATVVFRGVQRQLVLDYFVATATYSGIIPARLQRETIFATYEPEPAPAFVLEPVSSPTVDPVVLSEPAAPLSASSFDILPVVIATATAVVMLLALLFLLYFFLYKNARLVRAFPTGKRRVLARKHLRLEKGEIVFKIDPSLEVYREDSTHLIVLNRSLASKPGQLTVLWGDQLMVRVGLKHEVDITEELIRVFEDGLEPLVSEDAAAIEYTPATEAKNGSGVLEGVGTMSEKGRRKRTLRVAAATTVVLLFGSGIAFFATLNSISAPSEPEPSELQTDFQETDGVKGSATGDTDGAVGKDGVGDTGRDGADAGVADDLRNGAGAQGVEDGTSGGSSNGSTGGGSGSTGGGSSNGSTGGSGKTWHEGWNEWVVDVSGHYEQRLVRGAWDEQKGHYGSVCRTCGAEVTGNFPAHVEATGHMGGYYEDWIFEGTIHHEAEYENLWVPEQGHNVWHEGYWD
ncbi:MAG: hypothetical protein LBK67_05365 [Coriobacteriales bacterium]|jgi:uncharacterized membrane protein YgcG|nr:hypothetical protein [Coriobacteriales bacterium]